MLEIANCRVISSHQRRPGETRLCQDLVIDTPHHHIILEVATIAGRNLTEKTLKWTKAGALDAAQDALAVLSDEELLAVECKTQAGVNSVGALLKKKADQARDYADAFIADNKDVRPTAAFAIVQSRQSICSGQGATAYACG